MTVMDAFRDIVGTFFPTIRIEYLSLTPNLFTSLDGCRVSTIPVSSQDPDTRRFRRYANVVSEKPRSLSYGTL